MLFLIYEDYARNQIPQNMSYSIIIVVYWNINYNIPLLNLAIWYSEFFNYKEIFYIYKMQIISYKKVNKMALHSEIHFKRYKASNTSSITQAMFTKAGETSTQWFP
jgi:hypothetical protein